MTFTLRPVKFFKFDKGSGNVVKVGAICSFHVHTMLFLRQCQVLPTSNTFILGS